MSAMAYQITSLATVYPIVYSGTDQRKHQSSASLAFVWGIHRSPVNSLHKGQWCGKCFHLVMSSCFSNTHRHPIVPPVWKTIIKIAWVRDVLQFWHKGKHWILNSQKTWDIKADICWWLSSAVWCLYNGVNFLPNPHNRHSSEGEIWNVFCESKLWFIYPESVDAVVCKISCYIGLRYVAKHVLLLC